MLTYKINYATAEIVYGDDYNFYSWGGFFRYRLGGDAEDNTMWGGMEADYINGFGGNDRILGFGDGKGHIREGGIIYLGDDVLDGGAGHDIISGGGGDDSLYGGTGNDKLYGDGEDDFLEGGTGQNLLDGGSGFDMVDYSRATESVTVNLEKTSFQNVSPDTRDKIVNCEGIYGSDYDDTLIGNNIGNYLFGGWGSDVIHGKGGNDALYGADGNDIISGGTGNDLIYGDYFGPNGAPFWICSDILYGDAGNDWLFGGEGPDKIYGGVGNDLLVGGIINDIDGLHYNVLSGTSYGFDGHIVPHDSYDNENKLYGGAGNDWLLSAGDGDRLEGGTGSDMFVFTNDVLLESTANIRVVDFNKGEGDKIVIIRDEISSEEEYIFYTYDFFPWMMERVSQNGNDTHINTGVGQIVLSNVESATLDAGDFTTMSERDFIFYVT